MSPGGRGIIALHSVAKGGEVVTVAPDYSPSAIHADYHLPVRIGTDAALALAMAKVIIDADLYDVQFVQEQTDLPLLVRKDTGRFLRGDEVYEGEREDQFFWWDASSDTLAAAPRHTLASADVEPALEGSYEVVLKDWSKVEVEPVFARLRRHLEDYTPEKAGEICQLHPDNIRALARKVATRKTKIFIGWNSGKYYHGDLMERSMALLLGLTGNWGKKGTGTRSWAIMGLDGQVFLSRKEAPGQEAAQKHIAGIIAALSIFVAKIVTYEILFDWAAPVGELAAAIKAGFGSFNAFREQFSGLAANKPDARLGAKARITSSGDAGSARPTRSMVSTLAREAGGLLAQGAASCWHWQSRRVRLVDGATVTLADTEANQAAYPQPSSQKPGLGFPICRVVALMCLGSGALLDTAMGPCVGKGSDEQSLLRKLLDTLEADDILLGDAFYATYFLLAALIGGGVDGVFEQHGARKRSTDFSKGEQLGARDHIITLTKPSKRPDWMSPYEYDQAPDTLAIREFQAGGKVMVTTFLCPKQTPKSVLKSLYRQRWHVELDLRNIKTTLGMEALSCKSP